MQKGKGTVNYIIRLTTVRIMNFNSFYRTESIVDLINVILPSRSRTILNLNSGITLRKSSIVGLPIELMGNNRKLKESKIECSTIVF